MMDREPQSTAPRAPRVAVHESIAERVAAVVHAAEAEAEAARRDIDAHRRAAEQEARDYVGTERRRADEEAAARVALLEELTAATRRDVEALGRSVGALAAAMREEPGAPAASEPPWAADAPPPTPAQHRRYVSSVPDPPSDATATEPPRPPLEPDSARLVAIEMAVGGASRGEVERHLERELGTAVAPSLLDGVFGPDREATTRLSWGSS